MLTLPTMAGSPNERALGQWYTERLTGLTGSTVTLSYTVAQTLNGVPLVLVFKNGTLLDPGGGGATSYTVSGGTVTLVTAAVAGDVFVVWYLYRT